MSLYAKYSGVFHRGKRNSFHKGEFFELAIERRMAIQADAFVIIAYSVANASRTVDLLISARRMR